MKKQHFLSSIFAVALLGSLISASPVLAQVNTNSNSNVGGNSTNTNNNDNANNNNNVNNINIGGGGYQYQAQPAYYQNPVNSLICTPASQSANINQTITLTATGGNGSYTWTVPEIGQSSTGATFQVAYGSAGYKTVTVRSDSQTATCSIQVVGGQVLSAIDFPNTGEGGIHAMNIGGILLALAVATGLILFLDRRFRLN